VIHESKSGFDWLVCVVFGKDHTRQPKPDFNSAVTTREKIKRAADVDDACAKSSARLAQRDPLQRAFDNHDTQHTCCSTHVLRTNNPDHSFPNDLDHRFNPDLSFPNNSDHN